MDKSVQVYSHSDSWHMQIFEGKKIVKQFFWSNDDAEGGEVRFIEALEFLGFNCYHDEVY